MARTGRTSVSYCKYINQPKQLFGSGVRQRNDDAYRMPHPFPTATFPVNKGMKVFLLENLNYRCSLITRCWTLK